jgi:ATP-dependent DNA helicase RecG
MITRRRASPLTPEELTDLLAQGPTDRLLLLPAKIDAATLAGDLSALANASGGYAILGVTAKGTPQKEIDPAPLRERVIEAGLLTDPPLILPTPQIVTSGERTVVVAHVPPGLPHIYSLHGRYLTRTSGQTRPLTTPELRQLLFERTDSGFESSLVEEASLDDLDPRQIERYLSYIEASPQDDLIQVLLARGCVALDEGSRPDAPRHRPTVAGVLLFGREPQRFLRSAEIICVRYSGDEMSDTFVRQDIGGPLADQIRQAEAFVVGNMHREMRLQGMAREEVAEYPIAVVREAIVNAIAHRDYSIRGEGIRLLMYRDRLTVYSPGRLPGHVTLENLKEERYSRNEAVVAILSDLGYIERLGYGIDRMVAAMQALGMPAPLFEEMANGFQVTLNAARKTLPQPAPPPPRPPASAPDHFLNERQEQALAFLQEHGRITNSDYQKLAPDVSSETIRRDLADMVEQDILIKVGSKRATYYILK